MQLIADLRARKLIQDIMPGTEEQLAKELTTAYIGFDPTADSLHVGSLLPITLLMRLQRAGHKPIALIGGATGMIGDPTGKSTERNLLDAETIRRNCDGQRKQLEKFLDFDPAKPNCAELVNNYDWLKEYSFLEFIRDIGKHITVGYMMSKESVQKRLETGLSFTEFTYQLIQGYDFFYLNKHKRVKLQIGGADQWGNILTGTELIRRIGAAEGTEGNEAFAFTCPLITKSDGGKFGKTESGTVWLDPARTSPYQFYQFWMNLKDADAVRMAYTFSFKDVSELDSMVAAHNEAPHLRQLQKALAEEMTVLVHSEEDLQFARAASEMLFSNTAVDALRDLNEQQLLDVMDGVPQVKGRKETLNNGFDLLTFLAETGIYPSKGEAKKAIHGGGLSINKEKVTMTDQQIGTEQLLNEKYLLVQKGKNKMILAIFE
jgi:tyrosyl-tRNA synthetase